MSNKINTYKDLIVWQKSMELVSDVYSISKTFPVEEKFGIVSQLNRAAVSIPSNIAEGWGRETSKNYLQFLRISRGSLMELETLIIISKNLGFIEKEKQELISNRIEEVGKILQGLIKGIQQKILITEEGEH
ncbi:MAG: four helix bundle protein [Bacteroidia bacterium]|nr:four helix bundle protein [Bacteroidia bacterium]